MPRTKKAPAGPPTPNALIASAARITAGRRKNLSRSATGGWQDEAWEMLDAVGELEFYREWMANALSRCTLSAVEVVDGEEVPAPPEVQNLLTVLFDGVDGQEQMLASMGGLLSVPGEAWLCGLTAPSDDPDLDQWRVLSADEVKPQGNRWQIERGDGEPEAYDDEEVYLVRIWRQHPRKYVEATSSVRSALPILRELVGLSKHTAASIDSRLAGAGIIVVPTEITFASPATPDDSGEDPETDPFIAALTEAMITAIEDRSSAAALVPIVLKAPAEHLDKIKHLTFTTPLSGEARELRQETITRLAASLDVPAEVLTGMADVNHWTGWLLDENAIKMHVEPLLSVVTSGLTSRFLWPMLQGNAPTFDPALRRYRLKGSTEKLRQRPNRSAEAEAAHTAIKITDEAWARETGLSKDDLLVADSPEFRTRVLMRMATTHPDPAIVAGALAALGVTIDLPVAVDPATDPAAPALPAGDTDTPADPGAGATAPVPDTQPGVDAEPAVTAGGNVITAPDKAAALQAAAEVLVNRGVERAWNRLGKRGRRRLPVDLNANIKAALDGAWDQAERVAILTGVDARGLTDALETYACTLLTTGADLNPVHLRDHLARLG